MVMYSPILGRLMEMMSTDMRVGLLRVHSMLLINAVECGRLSSNSNVLDLIQTALTIQHVLAPP